MRTFIFGAGASRSFFTPELTTPYLTEKVCSEDEWIRVIDKYKANNGQNKYLVKVDTIMAVIHAIKEFLSDANFEQIAEVFDAYMEGDEFLKVYRIPKFIKSIGKEKI